MIASRACQSSLRRDSVAVMLCRLGLLDSQRRSRRGRQGPPLPDTVSPEGLDSNILSNIPLESGCTGSVEV